MIKKKTYCELCGQPEGNVNLKYFDKETGKHQTKKVCQNLHCVRGCSELGHQWTSWSGTWFTYNRTRTCLRCGDEECSGYY